MSQHALLNNVDHRDLRVRTGHGPGLGDDVMCAPTFPAEFRDVQSHYPIVFLRDASGGFQPVALFGLQERSNLFLDGDRWDATYIPLSVQRQPFLIGASGSQRMVHVDLAHPRVSRSDGEPLFREHGGTTDYLDHASAILLALHDGLAATPSFVDALQRHALLEPFVLDARLPRGGTLRLAGFHTIDEERLQALDGAALAQLSGDGHLLPLYMAVASMSRLRDLIERHGRRDVAGA